MRFFLCSKVVAPTFCFCVLGLAGGGVLHLNSAEAASKKNRPAEGSYNGTFTVHSVAGMADRSQEEIRSHVTQSGGDLKIVIEGFRGRIPVMKPLEAKGWRHYGIFKPVTFDLSIPDIQAEPFKMKQVEKKGQSCYVGKAKYEVDFCLDDENFTLDVLDQDEKDCRVWDPFRNPKLSQK